MSEKFGYYPNVVVQIKKNKEDRKSVFGPGQAHILELVKKTGSLKDASKEMDISYSKAWRLIKETEETLEIKLLKRSIGGTGGGGSVLTDDANLLLEYYKGLTKSLNEAADKYDKEIKNRGE